ncbi:hypothetical protein DsansV1_C22g0172361 [Dioscorea sansibarensis]
MACMISLHSIEIFGSAGASPAANDEILVSMAPFSISISQRNTREILWHKIKSIVFI